MSDLIETNEINQAAILALVTTGDMSSLSESQKIDYYNHVCQTMGLNPATRPFAFIMLQGKLVLYAQRNCTDQLMSVREISAEVKSAKNEDGIFIVEARASTKEGRFADDLGCVSIEGLKGDAKANAIMKAHTKAKRRAVLSLVGLSFLDETEVETIPQAAPARGYIKSAPQSQPKALPDNELPPIEAYNDVDQTPVSDDPFVQHAIEIFESDAKEVQTPKRNVITDKQRKLAFAKAKAKNLSNEQIDSARKEVIGDKHMAQWDYRDLNKWLDYLEKL